LARLPAGDYQVSVEAPGYFPAVPQTVTLAAADERNLGFTLNAVGGSVSGVVRSPGSNAVAGATVVIGWTNASAAYGDWRGDTRSTDALGRFQFVGLPPGAYRLSAGASGYGESVPVAVTVTNYSSSVSVDLTLRSASGVTGVVVDAGTLTPIAGARVEPNVYPPADTAVYSDAQGRFTLSGLATGSYRIYGIATNYLDGFAEITLAGSQTSALTIALSHVGRISGYVRGGVASNAAAHMPVVVWSEKDNLETVTDAQGYYVLDGISTGRYAIGLGSVNGMSKGRQDVSITATQWNLTVNFTSALSSISGTIHGVGGTPQSNATVYLVNGSDLLSSVQSDAQGGYRFWVYAADTYAVLARAAGALCAPVTHVAVGSNAQVTGQNGFAGSNALALEVVAAAGGAPVSNAEVRIQLLSDPTTHILANQISSNAAGWYAFSNVPPGSYRARIVADRFAAVETSVTLTGTLTTAHVELAAGRSIHGQVCTNGGVGLPFSQVDVCQSNGVLLTLWAGATGGYGTVSAPGSLLSMAVVSHRPFEAAFVAADMRSTTSRSDQVTLAAASTAVVSGVVRDGLGSLVAGAGLSLLTTQGTVIAVAQSDLDGRFSVPWWPSGSFVLKASALGYGSVQTNVTLVSGASLTGLSLTISEPLAVGAAVTNSSSFVLQRADGLTRPHGALPYRGGWWGDESYNGIPHPSVARDRYGKDFMVDVFNPWYDAYQHGRHNCNGVLDNYSQAKYWNQMMDKTYNNWCTAYENMKAQQGGQAVVTVSKGILWGAKAVKFLWSVAEMGGNIEKCIKDPSGFGMTPADLDKAKYALNTLNSIAGYVGTARSAAATGQNVNNAGLTLQSISAAMGQVKDLIASTPMDKFMPQAAGLLSDGIQLYNGFADFLDEANKMGDFQSAFDYLNAQYSYDYAIQQYWKNRRQMINSIADCKTGDDTDPTDPPPQEPSNPGDTGGGINGFSGDPNIKVATGYSTLGYIPAGERIYYTIHFENMTNVTAPAAQVSIADQLDARLDWTTLQLGDIGFNQVLAQVPAGLTAYATHGIEVATDPNPVSVSAFLDQSSGVVTWTLQSVDRATGQLPDDPLAGFLPPNTNPPCGEGYVSFSVCVRTNLAHGDTITNSARIVFDVNAPIETPMVTNTVDLIAPSSAVNALPSRSASTFTVSWAGTDSGSGIATYDVYMNQDSGALTLWLTGTTATSASFNGAVDVTYGFTCVARDHVGLVEAGPRSTLDTSTRVVSATPPSGVSASKGTYTDRVLLSWNTAIYATAYEVWRAAVNDSAQAAKLADAAALLYADTSVQPGSRYYYWVKSRNEAGLSDFSLSDMGWRRSAAAGTLRYGDFDGDGIADIGLYQESTGYWYVMLSASGNSLVTAQLGGPTYRPVTGDYDGDGKTDPAVYQELSGAWAVMMSSQGYGLVTTAFGGSGYTAVPADYDGDGKADPAVYASASGAWVVMMSGQGYAPISAAFGGVGFSAVPSDYDGDGKADPAVYQEASGAWAVMMSSQGYAPVSAAFGGPGYRPVPMDYDGDGKVDPAVYAAAAGLWSVMMSAQGYTPVSTVFGGVGYWPVPTDYDGDGRMDPALYQTVTGQWLMMLSGSGYIQSGVIFGGAGFDPVLPVR